MISDKAVTLVQRALGQMGASENTNWTTRIFPMVGTSGCVELQEDAIRPPFTPSTPKSQADLCARTVTTACVRVREIAHQLQRSMRLDELVRSDTVDS
jgi:hypothetical protein